MASNKLWRGAALFKEIWFLWIVCLVVNSITFLFVKFNIRPGNRTLALHYNVIAGVEWYGKGNNLYFIPAAGLAISIANFVLYRTFKNAKSFLPLLTVFASLCVSITALLAILFLSNVN